MTFQRAASRASRLAARISRGAARVLALGALALVLVHLEGPQAAAASCGNYVLVNGQLVVDHSPFVLPALLGDAPPAPPARPCNGPFCQRAPVQAPVPVPVPVSLASQLPHWACLAGASYEPQHPWAQWVPQPALVPVAGYPDSLFRPPRFA
jgi:hypothetical protein